MIRRIVGTVALMSVPILMMLQVLQGYRYQIDLESAASLEVRQEDQLEKNRLLLASIAVYDAPERIYTVATQTLDLSSPSPERILHVRYPDSGEVRP
ncbi:MAG: hypothetical protein MI717_11085 [Spirochaetales bacterium]|nr:hypothetical protein [Spirochaetales bacterium]